MPDETYVQIIFESDCVTVTILHEENPVTLGTLVKFHVDTAVLEGYTDSEGKIDFGCGFLSSSTTYTALFEISGYGDIYHTFTTNSAGGAEVTVEI